MKAIQVNGHPITTDADSLTVAEILTTAGRSAAVDVGELRYYYLERIDGRHRFESLEDTVTLADGDEFLAVHAGSTPVA